MNTDNTQDGAEPTPASHGSVQPLAWAVVCPTGEPLTVRWTWHECLDVAGPADEIVPLYRQPQPALTDEEVEALKVAWQLSCSRVTPLWGEEKTFRTMLERLG